MWSHVATFSTVSGITLAQLNSSRSQVLVRVTWPPCLTPQPPTLSTSNTKLPVEPLQGCLFSSFHVEMGLHLGMYLGRQFSRVHLVSLGLRSSYVLFTSTATSCRSTHSRLHCAARPEETSCLLASCIIALITQSKGFVLPVSAHACTFTCNFNFYSVVG